MTLKFLMSQNYWPWHQKLFTNIWPYDLGIFKITDLDILCYFKVINFRYIILQHYWPLFKSQWPEHLRLFENSFLTTDSYHIIRHSEIWFISFTEYISFYHLSISMISPNKMDSIKPKAFILIFFLINKSIELLMLE